MDTRFSLGRLTAVAAAVLITAGCQDPVAPAGRTPGLTAAAAAPLAVTTGVVLDQQNGSLNESGTMLAKGFDPTNPHLGDAIVATVYWLGSTNIVDSVIDFTTDGAQTHVGNKYNLVEYVTSGGISMATYVATNVQNFPDPNPVPGPVLAVRAYLSDSVTDGGITISAWTGVATSLSVALGAHRSGSGAGSTATIADAGAIAVGTGTLAHTVTMSNGLVGRDRPVGFTDIGSGSDQFIVNDGAYAVQSAIGSVDPQWNWNFNSPSTWLATVLALNPPLHLIFTVQPSTTLPLMAITPAVRVSLLDALGNVATSFTGSVTIAIGQNGGLVAPGALSGTKTVTVVNGVATFADLSIDQPGNGYTLRAAASGVTGTESAAFNIGAF